MENNQNTSAESSLGGNDGSQAAAPGSEAGKDEIPSGTTILPEESVEVPPEGDVNLNIRDANSKYSNFAKVVNQQNTEIIKIFTQDKSYAEREKNHNFQKNRDCFLIEFNENAELAYSEFDEKFLEECLNSWNTRRILVVSGKPNIGKTVTALRLCQKLSEIPPAANGKRQTYIVKPLKLGIKLNIFELVKDAGKFANTTLVFENVFAGGNLDLGEFFSNLDSHQLREIIAAMGKNNIYLLFTTNTEMVSLCEQNLRKLNLLAAHPLLSKEKLKSFFDKRLKLFAETKNIEPEKIDAFLNREAADLDRLFEKHQIPRIVEFIEIYLERVIDEGINIRAAIEELEHLNNWFLDELAVPDEADASEESVYLNFETWCFVLTLTLTQCVRGTSDSSSPYEGVPLMYFEEFRENITRVLMEKIGISYPEKITLKNYISEQNWLTKGRAEIYRDGRLGIDMIRFKYDWYPEQMWEVLLKKSRRTLFSLIPVLEKLAHQPKPGIRSLAARILGRIGEIDIDEITLRLIQKWIRSTSTQQMATVGYLYEGIIFSQDEDYKNKCRDFLKGMPYLSFVEGRTQIHSGLWTAIAVYKQIGKYTLTTAMEQLKRISEAALTGQVELEEQLTALPSMVFKDVEKQLLSAFPGLTTADYQKIRTTMENEALKELRKSLLQYYESNDYFKVFNYTLISLCLSVSPLKVFNELQKWFYSDNTELKMFIALNFLREGGICQNLEEHKISLNLSSNSDDDEVIRISPVVNEMASHENSVTKIAGFLENIFSGFDISDSSLFRSYYRQQFFELLKNWAKESLQSERHEAIVSDLFVAFLNNSLSYDLSNGLDELLKYDAEFSDPENRLYSFQEKVFEKSMQF